MNLRLMFSSAARLVCTNNDFLNVMMRFLAPMQLPLIMMKSLFTSPYCGKPPIGVMFLSVISYSVEALFLMT